MGMAGLRFEPGNWTKYDACLPEGWSRIQAGRIWLDGVPTGGLSDDALCETRLAKLGFVFQFHFLLPEFTALENVMVPALIHAKKNDGIRQRAVSLLETVGLRERLEHKPGELSGGEQQRVAIARALMMSPRVLLADEPTGDLDPMTGSRVIDLLSELKESLGVTMIVATHNIELARAMDRILVLKGGHLEPQKI